MNVFDIVKANVSARAAAEHYGLRVGRNGMACCPFHPDKHPSMKLDQRFHCFGCGADGDAVNYVAKIANISNYEAAVKLLEDFGISYDPKIKPSKKSTGKQAKKAEEELRIRRVQRRLQSWLANAEDTLLRYDRLLRNWKEEHKPKNMEEEWDPLFLEALEMMTRIEYYLDILFFGSDEERLDFFIIGERR